jgi:hypothetical protein
VTRRDALTERPSAPQVRRWLRQTRRIPESSPWYRLYLAGFLSLPLLIVAVTAESPADPGRTADVLAATERWLPFVLALTLLGLARMATWAGLVVPERAEVAWVFTSPLSRTSLVRPRVGRAVAIGAGTGAAWPPSRCPAVSLSRSFFLPSLRLRRRDLYQVPHLDQHASH